MSKSNQVNSKFSSKSLDELTQLFSSLNNVLSMHNSGVKKLDESALKEIMKDYLEVGDIMFSRNEEFDENYINEIA